MVQALGGITRVFLSPDGELTRLPFESIPTPDGEFLIDRYEFSYVTCGRDLLRVGPGTARAAEPIVIAEPQPQRRQKQSSHDALNREFCRGW